MMVPFIAVYPDALALLLRFDCQLYSSFSRRFDECSVVALVLVGILDCEFANRVVEGFARTYVT
jgi:hypothetical protein